MIAFAKPLARTSATRAIQDRFTDMLPQIRAQARMAFRALPREAQENLIAEVVANAFVAYMGLVARNKAELAYPTPLAQYAVRQVRAGRLVGTKLNARDVTSRYAQRKQNIRVERLDQFDTQQDRWREVLLEDYRSGPAEIAAARIDVAAWFQSLAPTHRKIAQALAQGEQASVVAIHFGLSAGRVSQLRQSFRQSWETFQAQAAAT